MVLCFTDICDVRSWAITGALSLSLSLLPLGLSVGYSQGYNFRFHHTYCEEGAIGVAVDVAQASHPASLEDAVLVKSHMRLKAIMCKEKTKLA